VRKDHNAGGKSQWMEGFFERPAPELWQAIREANASSLRVVGVALAERITQGARRARVP
jgi:hypothetical protein